MLSPPNHLKWIKRDNQEQIKWAIEYFCKKTKLSILGLEAANLELARMSESERKLLLTGMRNAWRAKLSRKRKTTGSERSRKNAFQIYLSSEAIKLIDHNSKKLKLTKTGYIEKLLTDQSILERHYKEKLETYKSQNNRTIDTEAEKENILLKQKLDSALKEIEQLRELALPRSNDEDAPKTKSKPNTQKSTNTSYDAVDFGPDL